ncbi:MAG: peptidylprolyl isomerase [Bacteroidetes bacterium]|nr:peptidylprolyl isomerase [Rhodothermia bacterium]MCS7155578.1 peptidylprolyl isomerase [Bacteroidota bacterium]MCX7906436.1 peptidylprolyl isomerase [Bacteroidota bacterium]MDW8137282.1 peptidylprolyl isomerase [Bacteroidota bacterium]MDW8284848.1 peptidylprolyl isomerase [Bacteroidota bacterium]
MAHVAQLGDRVRVHYTGTLQDGSIFDSSLGGPPLEFLLGAQEVIPGFERAVLGMAVGERKRVTIPAEEGYGPYDEDLIYHVPRSQVPPDLQVYPGQQLQLQAQTQSFLVTVLEVTDQYVVLDANHPLAGQELTFEIELLAIEGP